MALLTITIMTAGRETTVHHVRRGEMGRGGRRGEMGRRGREEGGGREGEGGSGEGECELGEMCAVLRVEGGDACANDC